MVNFSAKAAPAVHVVLVRVSRDDDGNAVLTKRGQLYDTTYKGELLVRRQQFPFYASARKLQELGAGPDDVVSMRWADTPQTTSMAARIGWAATRTVEETSHTGPLERKYSPPGFDRVEEANNVAVALKP